MKYIGLIILMFFTFCMTTIAGGKSRGDMYFDNGEYYFALESYQKDTKDPNVELKKARCYYLLNKADDAYKIYVTKLAELESIDLFYYASILHKTGKYKEAIEFYSRVTSPLRDSLHVNELLNSCYWAQQNSNELPRTLKPTRLSELGQSFGIQFYKTGVVYSSPVNEKNELNVDKNGMGFQNLYYSDLKNDNIVEGKKEFSENLKFPYHVGAVSFSPNFNRIYYTKTVLLKGNKTVLQIFTSRYDFAKNDWVEEYALPVNSNSYNCAHPTVTPDNKYVIFTSDMQGGFGKKDLYKIEIIEEGKKYGEAINLGNKINTWGDEMFPHINAEGVMHFSSNGRIGFGGLDVYRTKLKADGFGPVENRLKPINSSYDDFAYIENPADQDFAFLSSDRINQQDIIYYLRSESADKKTIKSNIRDSRDNKPVADARLAVVEKYTQTTVTKSRTDAKGDFSITVPGKYADSINNLELQVSSNIHKTKKIQLTDANVTQLETNAITLHRDEKVLVDEFALNLKNELDGTPIKDVEVTIKDSQSGKLISKTKTLQDGSTRIVIPKEYQKEGQKFTVGLSKKDQFEDKVFETNIEDIFDFSRKPISLNPTKSFKPEVQTPVVDSNYPAEIKTTVRNTKNGQIIQNANVVIKDKQTGKPLVKVKSGVDGTISYTIPNEYKKQDQVFEIEVSKGEQFKAAEFDVDIQDVFTLNTKGVELQAKTADAPKANNGFDSESLVVTRVASKVVDKETGKPIIGADVIVKDAKTGQFVGKTRTMADGTYNIPVPKEFQKPNQSLEVNVSKGSDYEPFNFSADAKGIMNLQNEQTPLGSKITQAVQNVIVTSTVTTSFSNSPIADAVVKILDTVTKAVIAEAKTDERGIFSIELKPELVAGNKMIVIEVTKGEEFVPKEVRTNASDLENLRRDGIALTPIFNDEVLDEISKMVIMHDRKVIMPDYYATLDRLAAYLQQNPKVIIKLNGHTDIRGERIVNLDLSQSIAVAAKQYLIDKGIPEANIIARGYGDRYLVNRCQRGTSCSISDHAANNRVEVVVWKILK